MGIKKNLKKLLGEPPEMRIAEIINLLKYYGFDLARVKGSHYILESREKTFVLPVHNGKTSRPYLKLIKLYLLSHGKEDHKNADTHANRRHI